MKNLFLQEGPLRVAPQPRASSSPQSGGLESHQMPAAVENDEKPYLARLVLLVPAEVISLYMALKPAAVNFLPWFGLICLALVILVRVKATAVGGRPEWLGVGISTGSFALWLYATGGSLPGLPPPADAGIISVAVGVWIFAVPYFYTGSTPPPTAPAAPPAGEEKPIS